MAKYIYVCTNTISDNITGKASFTSLNSYYCFFFILHHFDHIHLINITSSYPHKIDFNLFLSNTKLGNFSFGGNDGKCSS